MICLLGYMGSGKSLIANLLSEKLKIEKIDLDWAISQKVGLTIPEIFEKKGEIYFRKVEKEILEDLLNAQNDIILSLGGGTPCYYNNMESIKEKSKSIYLRANVKTLVERLSKEKDQRPLVARIGEDDLPNFIGQHLFERNQFYNRAEVIIDVDNLSPDEIVEKILEKL